MNEKDIAQLVSMTAVAAFFGLYGKGFFKKKTGNETQAIKERGRIASLLSRADTKKKRICLLLSPFFFLVSGFMLMDDTHNLHYPSSVTLPTALMLLSSAVLLIVSLTKLLDWIDKG